MCRSSSMAPFLTSQANADVAQDAGSQSMRSEFSKPCKKVNGNIIDDNVDWGLDQDTLEPIAVIGFSFTFPEDATSAETFWSMMMEGRCVSTEWPQDRLNGSALYHPDPERLSSVPISGGHFIRQDIAAFDAPFFSISATEASAMDPQQRMLLETSYRALENAGLPLEKVTGTKTSVYTGCFTDDYKGCFIKDPEVGSKHALVGVSPSMLSGRLSWFFNFKGPSVTVDTACSSSLVAVDMGCQSLLSKTADISLVTGSNLIFAPEAIHALSNMSMLSPDGRCYSFDARANGYGRGEGISALILKRLCDAVRDNDTIRAVIRSSGTNQDGHTPGITQPDQDSQVALIKETYEKGGLDMTRTRYFEAHGTGTPVGDPLEVGSIGRAFKNMRKPNEPILIGAVKSNIGHLEGSSGIASMIKTILILERALIPPNTNFKHVNPSIDTNALNIEIPLEPTPWPCQGLRRASVNSFGASGTNAHVVIDDAFHFLARRNVPANHRSVQYPPSVDQSKHMTQIPQRDVMATALVKKCHQRSSSPDLTPANPRLLILSAANEDSLEKLVEAYKQNLANVSLALEIYPTYVDSLLYTLDTRRSLLPWRSYATIEKNKSLVESLTRMSKPSYARTKLKVGFIFTGQGAQWARMGCDLLVYPVFRTSLEAADLYFSDLGSEWSLIDELSQDKESSRVDSCALSQPICTALQVALVDLLRSFDVTPSAVIGHSSGEIAAAYCIGAITRESAWKISYFRGALSSTLAGNHGAMMAVGMAQSQIQPLIEQICEQFPSRTLVIGCINSPTNVTVSGDEVQINALKVLLEEQKVFVRKLKVDVAYHSPHMDLIAAQFALKIRKIASGSISGSIPLMISSCTGRETTSDQLRDEYYWVRNMVSPVQFSKALKRLWEAPKNDHDGSRGPENVSVFVEIGPHSALQGPIKDILNGVPRGETIGYHSCLVRNVPGTRTLLDTLGRLHCRGVQIDLRQINLSVGKTITSPAALCDLPEYQFDHSRTYWHEGRLSRQCRFPKHAKLDLLGKPVDDWNPLEARWRNFIKFSEVPWIKSHEINGTILYPAAGMLVMAIEAAHQLADSTREINGFKISDARFLAALKIPSTSEGIETQLHLRALQSDNSGKDTALSEYKLYAWENGNYIEITRGTIQVLYEHEKTEVDGGKEAQAQLKLHQRCFEKTRLSCSATTGTHEFYQKLRGLGYTFGEDFRVVENVQTNEAREAVADVKCYIWPSDKRRNPPQTHIVHPITLDGIFQAMLAVFCQDSEDVFPTAIPNYIKSLWISRAGLSAPQTQSVKLRGQIVSSDNLGFETSFVALNQNVDRLLVEAEGVKLRYVIGSATPIVHHMKQICHNVSWMPDIDLLSADEIRGFCQSGQPPSSETVYQQHGQSGSTKSQTRTDDMERYRQLGNYLNALTFKNPGTKILQLNSRGGECTISLMRAMMSLQARMSVGSRYDTWTVTDPSQEILKQAHETLADHVRISFQQFKVDEDPLAQGFETEFYDIVLFENYVTGTIENTKTVFQHIRKLLKPFGKLILLTSNISSVITNICQDVNQDLKPLLSRSDLHVLTTKSGFSGIGLELADYSDDMGREYGTLITTAVTSCPASVEPLKIYLVIDTASTHQQALAHSIQSSMGSEGRCEILSWNDWVAERSFRRTVCVFFLELEHPLLRDIQSSDFDKLRNLLPTAKGVLWLSNGGGNLGSSPDVSIVDGLARVLRLENETLKFVTAKLETSMQSLELQVRSILKILNGTDFETNDQNYESAFLEVNNQLLISRLIDHNDLTEHVHSKSLPQQSALRKFGERCPLKLAVRFPGLLETLHFVEDSTPMKPLGPEEVEIKVHAVGLNFKDLLQALGRVGGSTFGNECAGIVHRAGADSAFEPGDRVCLATTAAFNTFTRANAAAVARVPEGITLIEAAAVPTQFGTAYIAIHHLAHMQNGESILIHSGAGGTGQAAIQLAKCLSAEIFVTVGSDKKKQFLIDEYSIPEDHIFYSRDTSFAKGIKRLTQNRGVDVVLNTLSGEGLLASWDCIASYGRFVELSKMDIQANASLPMAPFLRNVSFTCLEGSVVANERPRLARSAIEAVLELFVQKRARVAKPLHVYSISETEKALKMLQSSKSVGKIVLEISSEAIVPTTLNTRPSFRFDSNSTYLISGGLGGLGKCVARWMAQRGARYILLLSRSGARSKDNVAFLKELEALGVSVEAPECDVADDTRLRFILERSSRKMPPVKGCIQGTAVLQDFIFETMSYSAWATAIRSKVVGSWNLHSILPSDLSFFVLLSSVSGVLGTVGQANYAAGNTYMDALAHYRIARGQKAAVLDLGCMISDGMLADNLTLRQKVLASGHTAEVSRAEFHALLDYYCDPGRAILSQEECQTVYGLSLPATMRVRGLDSGHRMAMPFFRHMFQIGTSAQKPQTTTTETRSQRQRFEATETLAEAGELVCKTMMERLASDLPSLGENPDTDKPLYSYGVDSLMAIQLQRCLAIEFGADVSIFVLLSGTSLSELGIFIAQNSDFRPTCVWR